MRLVATKELGQLRRVRGCHRLQYQARGSQGVVCRARVRSDGDTAWPFSVLIRPHNNYRCKETSRESRPARAGRRPLFARPLPRPRRRPLFRRDRSGSSCRTRRADRWTRRRVRWQSRSRTRSAWSSRTARARAATSASTRSRNRRPTATHWHRRSGHARDQSLALPQNSVRPGQGFRADHADRARTQRVGDDAGARRSAQRNLGPRLHRYLRRNPGQLNYASGGNGSAGHMAGELMKSRPGFRPCTFRTRVRRRRSWAAGRADRFHVRQPGVGLAQIRGGKLKALAVTTPQRAPSLPDVPTMAEAACRALTSLPGSACSRPPARPPPSSPAEREIHGRLGHARNARTMARMGAEPAPMSSEQFARWSATSSRSTKSRQVLRRKGRLSPQGRP